MAFHPRVEPALPTANGLLDSSFRASPLAPGPDQKEGAAALAAAPGVSCMSLSADWCSPLLHDGRGQTLLELVVPL